MKFTAWAVFAPAVDSVAEIAFPSLDVRARSPPSRPEIVAASAALTAVSRVVTVSPSVSSSVMPAPVFVAMPFPFFEYVAV